MILLFLLILSIVFIFINFINVKQYIRCNFYTFKLPSFTTLKWNPLFGHALSFPHNQEDFFKFFERACLDFAKATKHKMVVSWFGTYSFVVLLHPSYAGNILKSSKELTKSSAYDLLRPWIKDGLSMSAGRKWHQRRKIITPSFHHAILLNFLEVMNDHASIFIKSVDQSISQGSEVDILHCLKLCAFDIICETAMGVKIEAQLNESSDYVQAVHSMNKLVQKRITNPILLNETIFKLSGLNRKQKKILKVLHNQSKSVIEDRMKAKMSEEKNTKHQKSKKAFLDILLSAETEDGKKLSAEDIQEEVDAFMFAGHDTSSIALTWAIYLLGRYPDKQRKVQDEIDQVFKDNECCNVTFNTLNQLTYLDLVIKEVLRLYPSIPFIGRKLKEDIFVDGCLIPKGQSVNIFIYFIHRHPDLWDEPNKFIPERFDVENRLKRNLSPFSYIPFSAGPRNCIGQRFALQEQKVILAKFFRQFSVVSFDKEENIKLNSSLLEPVQTLSLKIQRRH